MAEKISISFKRYLLLDLSVATLTMTHDDHTHVAWILGSPQLHSSLKSKVNLIWRPSGNRETRCVKRKVLLETLAEELPQGTIRFCSKVSSIAEDGYLKLVHLADGSIVKTKALIGCDGVNSVIAKWLGLADPNLSGRSAIRGMAMYDNPCNFPTKFLQFFGNGFRSGFLPCDGHIIYWFFTFTSPPHCKP
ncbi:hypothetical protein Sjap_003763 [Stephania japonica]|uniref:FAD-binding domain-containing protein n=1 Tax=Stephania japonica TaxID=461633 RepID=A0AAP0KPG6_9MAGN